ncbi:MAG TPA: hypothetical protein VIP11_06020 [Gemmatimonadaceae bacterium]
MHYKELIVLLGFSNVVLFSTTLVFVGLWIRARERAIRASVDSERKVESKEPDLEHLVNAVDAIAVEVERISEAQRFTAKVLVERVDPSAAKRLPVPERVVTPH